METFSGTLWLGPAFPDLGRIQAKISRIKVPQQLMKSCLVQNGCNQALRIRLMVTKKTKNKIQQYSPTLKVSPKNCSKSSRKQTLKCTTSPSTVCTLRQCTPQVMSQLRRYCAGEPVHPLDTTVREHLQPKPEH